MVEDDGSPPTPPLLSARRVKAAVPRCGLAQAVSRLSSPGRSVPVGAGASTDRGSSGGRRGVVDEEGGQVDDGPSATVALLPSTVGPAALMAGRAFLSSLFPRSAADPRV